MESILLGYVYVLWSDSLRKRYIGSCRDLEKRINEHNRGKQQFTKGGKPWRLIYSEKYDSYSDARKQEIFLKSGVGRKFLDKLLCGEVSEWFKEHAWKACVG